MNNGWAITTSKDKANLIEKALHLSGQYQIPYVERRNRSLAKLKEQHQLTILLVQENEDLVVHHQDGKLIFHPGMAVPRLKVRDQGQRDSMIDAMSLVAGDTVLDCTLGLANDAIVASAVVGAKGRVDGLESSPLIYLITTEGLADYPKGSQMIKEAMANIRPMFGDYSTVLPTLDAGGYDIVYFDPMFDHPLTQSHGIAGLRAVANYATINPSHLAQAVRVARKRVVVKHRKGQLPAEWFHWIEGGKYSPIAFGVIAHIEKGESQ